VTLDHLVELAESGFGNLAKAVVDIGQGSLASAARCTPMRKPPCCD
jgi:hypothetical protein